MIPDHRSLRGSGGEQHGGEPGDAVMRRLGPRLCGGDAICKGRHVPMPKLDALVLENVKQQLLAPERLATILGAIMERRSQQGQAVVDRRKALEAEIVQKKEQLARLYQAIEEGVVDLDAVIRGTRDAPVVTASSPNINSSATRPPNSVAIELSIRRFDRL